MNLQPEHFFLNDISEKKNYYISFLRSRFLVTNPQIVIFKKPQSSNFNFHFFPNLPSGYQKRYQNSLAFRLVLTAICSVQYSDSFLFWKIYGKSELMFFQKKSFDLEPLKCVFYYTSNVDNCQSYLKLNLM